MHPGSDQPPSTSTRNLHIPKSFATLWSSCWVKSALPSGNPSVPCRRGGEQNNLLHENQHVICLMGTHIYLHQFYFLTHVEICLLSSAVTQSSAAPLRADRDTFPGVHLDRLSRGPHPGLCQNGGDAPESHGPGGAHSWAGCGHDACKCGQFWYICKIRTKWHKETKIRGLNLHLKLVEGDHGDANLLPSQIRDWNEELQGCRELARNSLQERLHRERSIFKVRAFRFWTY